MQNYVIYATLTNKGREVVMKVCTFDKEQDAIRYVNESNDMCSKSPAMVKTLYSYKLILNLPSC